jgi:hypothetical protein
MFHLNESFYGQQMPSRAKKLFQKTFKRYHKLDGGDEEIAIHMARQAVEKEYTKLDDKWIPIKAAKEIIRHNLSDTDDDDTDDDNDDRRVIVKRSNMSSLDRTAGREDDARQSSRRQVIAKLSPAVMKSSKRNVSAVRTPQHRTRRNALHTSSEEEDDDYDDDYDDDDDDKDDMNTIKYNNIQRYNNARNNNKSRR